MNQEGSAAERVFAIPELLETILLAYIASNAKIREPDQILESPVQGLFALQRVNKSCRNFITDSNKCRRVMFIDPPRPDSQEYKSLRNPINLASLDLLQPLWWLFETFEIFSPVDRLHTMQLDKDLHLNDLEISQSSDFGRETFPISTTREIDRKILRTGMIGMRRQEASWRNLPVFRIDPHRTVSVHQLFRFIDGTEGWYRVSFTVDKETTLGEFWDWWQGVCCVSIRDHCDVREGVVREGRELEFGRGWAYYPRSFD